MKTETKPQIPLRLEIKYESKEDLEEFASSGEFSTLILEKGLLALKGAIRKNKSECILFEIVNFDFKVVVKKPHYKTLLNRAISYYEHLEDYTMCQELTKLKSRL